ncbi:hypothetical protein K443DRAFT_7229 [Laccaria amethystina LaAM-08-1]|uniref:Pre-mRNA-splicing factor SYF2 n=1 Tax=Laccaria amethystina LaAM-08-1 TaxID=1095629 RepID=A0A0C9XHF6_9AGAR|nr:hypothetical protein K443DRAFT_7229 [Laccaria amethystina LaAM-08-1]
MFVGILVAMFVGTLLSPYILRRDRVFACGILTSTGITKDNLENHWQATDFVAIQSLLNCAEGQSFWLCGTDIRSGPGFLLGDPACDRLVFDPPPFEEIFDTQDTSNPKAYQKLSRFKSAYIRRVGETASRLTSGDILCLVICGHGLPDGRVVVGDAEARTLLVKSNLEDAVESCKAEVHLFITACYGGSWTSPYWNLFAAAERNFRGGVFTTCLLAEDADQHSLQAPKPGLWRYEESNNGSYHRFEEQQAKHNFGLPYSGQRVPTQRRLGRSTPEARTWLHKLRDHMGKTYPSADFTFSLCQQQTVWMPPKPSEDVIDRVVSKINNDIGKKGKISRKRLNEEEADITYFNEHNRVFNKKIARYYDKYTSEIRASFERGTAL